MISIPVQSAPFYTLRTTLGSTDFVLDFSWNQRCSVWYMSIYDLAGDLLLGGAKLVVGVNLLRRCTDSRLPLGNGLACVSNSSDDSPPGLNDFGPGLRVELIYYTPDDLV